MRKCMKLVDKGAEKMKKGILCLSTALLVLAFSTVVCAEAAAESTQQNIVQRIRAAESDEDATGQNASQASLYERIKTITAGENPAAAVAKTNALPRVAIMYVNNAKSTYDDVVDKEVFKYLNKAIPADTYDLVDGAPYVEKLNKLGYMDLSTAERADFMDAFAGAGIDYCIYLEVSPFVARDKVTFFTVGKDITTAIPFKIIDLATGKYIYTGKFTEKASDSSMIGGIGNKSVALKALDSAGEKILAVIQNRLPKTKAGL